MKTYTVVGICNRCEGEILSIPGVAEDLKGHLKLVGCGRRKCKVLNFFRNRGVEVTWVEEPYGSIPCLTAGMMN